MLTEHTVAQAAEAASLSGPVHFRPVTGSTNDDLLSLALGGAPEWTVVVAARQEAGRGRLGRSWASLPGTTLAVSVLLRPRVSPAEAPALSLMAAACMAEACLRACRVEAMCKWPNDLVAGHRKLGGVLPEARIEGDRVAFVVIGVGVNVSQRPEDFPPELRPTATSVASEGGLPDAPALLAAYLLKLADVYAPRSDRFLTAALDEYRTRCITLGRSVAATTTDGSALEGEAVAVGPAGELVIRTGAGERTVAFGEVKHLR